MLIITLIAMAAVTLLHLTGMLPRGSVGAAMTLFALYLVASLVVGIHDARSNGQIGRAHV